MTNFDPGGLLLLLAVIPSVVAGNIESGPLVTTTVDEIVDAEGRAAAALDTDVDGLLGTPIHEVFPASIETGEAAD